MSVWLSRLTTGSLVQVHKVKTDPGWNFSAIDVERNVLARSITVVWSPEAPSMSSADCTVLTMEVEGEDLAMYILLVNSKWPPANRVYNI